MKTATSERESGRSSRLSGRNVRRLELPKPRGWRAEGTGIADGIVDSVRGNRRRKTPGDPRRSVAARYASKEQYLMRAREHADTLVKGGYPLAADVPQVIKRMEELWDLARGREN